MILKEGTVVFATAGKECGGCYVITKISEKSIFIADGRKRKLNSPKRKNIKHLRFTDNIIDLNDMTDKKLRNVLSKMSTP